MYLLKQAIDALATPLVLAIFLGILAAVCRAGGRRSVALWFLTAAVLVAYLGAIDPVGDALLGPLEREYPPLRDDQLPSSVRYIVVLGSRYEPRDSVPITGALDEAGLARAVEGVRLARQFPRAQLVMSGGAPPGNTPSAVGYAVLARSLGVDAGSLIVLDKSLDTADEARWVKRLIGTEPFLLITSASHMPRAVALMRRMGTTPIPIPTAQRVSRKAGFGLRSWLPNALGLRNSESAIHEYLGLAALAVGAE